MKTAHFGAFTVWIVDDSVAGRRMEIGSIRHLAFDVFAFDQDHDLTSCLRRYAAAPSVPIACSSGNAA